MTKKRLAAPPPENGGGAARVFLLLDGKAKLFRTPSGEAEETEEEMTNHREPLISG